MFDIYLNSFKGFATLLRDGLSLDIVDFLENPSQYELKKISAGVESPKLAAKQSSEVNSSSRIGPSFASSNISKVNSSSRIGSSFPSSNTSAKISSAFKSSLQEVPDHLKDSMQLDCLVKTIPGDGSCLFNAAAQWIYGGFEHMKKLRKQSHLFLVQNWQYYHKFISLPFIETVVVGKSAYEVRKETYEEMKSFLLSDDSILCYINSSLDLSNLANMFNINIAIFTYSSGGSVVPHWTWIHPDPEWSQKSEYRNLMIREMWLYHEDNSHYDLLVNRPTPPPPEFCIPMPLPSSPTPPPPPPIAEQGWFSEAISTLNEIAPEEIPIIVSEESECTTFSPINFMHCPRGIGRPKKKRFGAPSLLKSRRKPVVDFIDANDNNDAIENPKKRGRGRPKGSKNKAKDEPASKKSRVEPSKKSLRQRAEEAAYDEDEEDSQLCLICFFKFNDPIKKDKEITRCPTCSMLVHELCLLKSGCISVVIYSKTVLLYFNFHVKVRLGVESNTMY